MICIISDPISSSIPSRRQKLPIHLSILLMNTRCTTTTLLIEFTVVRLPASLLPFRSFPWRLHPSYARTSKESIFLEDLRPIRLDKNGQARGKLHLDGGVSYNYQRSKFVWQEFVADQSSKEETNGGCVCTMRIQLKKYFDGPDKYSEPGSDNLKFESRDTFLLARRC